MGSSDPDRISSGRSADRLACAGRGTADSGDDPDTDPHAVGRAILVRKLAAQDRTRHELATALAAKNVPGEVAEELLDRFEEIGLVDDDAFARRWVESRQSRRHRSRLALRRELSGKGVERSTVDEALSEVSSEEEFEAARAYVEKVSRGMAGLQPAVRRRRLADRLARRGFAAEIIGRVLKNACDDGGAVLDPTLSDT
ncbi:MAG TPA: regulatory protein RecX [Microlunatus sp.]|nr:regulatory protein RecX [Microlunatus sp.]